MPRLSAIVAAGVALALHGAAEVKRVVVIKADGLPQRLIAQYSRPSEPGAQPRLPHIAEIFGRSGVTLENFYTRGISLSAPSWSLLDTGRHLEIHGNVEYDRYTLRPWDYLNFFPFYFTPRNVHMPGIDLLDQRGVPLLIDRFPENQRYQSFQLLQRGVRWSTLEVGVTSKLMARPAKDLFDEWQTGFSMSDYLRQATERDILHALKNPAIRYIDFFTGEYDHVAHLTPDRVAQLRALESLDALVGRLWSAIGASPLADSTALILVSDHGMNTDERIYSQGYNLVDWFTSAAGGAHHVITNRHPLTEYKIKGLNPFVSEVITPSPDATYLAGQGGDYPTLILDLDGNERASVGLRNNALNQAQILLEQLTQKRLEGAVRVAAIEALFELIDAHRAAWEGRLQDLKEEGHPDSPYVTAMRRLLRLTPADFDPGKFKIEDVIPRRALGDMNSIHDLQNYVVGLQPVGLVLAPDGSLDLVRSFRTVDYFAALTSISVRNNVQKEVARKPVDFIAVRVPAEPLRKALDDSSLGGSVWLYAGAHRQALILARGAADDRQLRYLPVENLTQDAAGVIHFERCSWGAGLPLALWEDPEVVVERDRAKWLDNWHNEREWLNAVHRTRYSNGLIGLTEQLLDPSIVPAQRGRERLRTDLLIFANDHWNFNVRGFNPGGNHGSLLRVSTHSVLMMAGGADTGLAKGLRIAAPYDSLSFVPTVLSLMGQPETNLPGPMIDEILHK